MRHHVKCTQAHGEIDVVALCPNPRHDLAQDARAIFKAAAKLPFPRVGTQKFVQQIAVAMLEIHKVRPHLTRDAGGAHVIGNQFLHLAIRPHIPVALHLEFVIQNRMPIRNARFVGKLSVRTAEASGMRQLKAQSQVIGCAILFAVGGQQEIA